MALVLVLSALALLSFLVLLVLTMTRNEDRASKASADIMEVRTLADLPAQIVISQIRRATSNLGTGFSWTSQPGMIRVFASSSADNAARPGLYEAYKLYSSSKMAVRGSEFDAAKEQIVPADWGSASGLYVDLNEPIPMRPVVKSGAKDAAATTDTKPKLVYPILDPGALKLVDGFEVAQGAAPGATETQPIPMPALWLYVLKDGRVIAPNGGSGATATFETGQASATNPIVARIAFWADDESCKINLNSASEPAPWDEPRANSKMDRAYVAYQPAQNEFHRHPGHPAFTALSPVFQAFGRDSASSTPSATTTNAFSPVPDPAGISTLGAVGKNSDSDAEKFRDYVESNHRPLPRTVDHKDNENSERGSRHGTQPPLDKVALKGERLFSTIDELLFDTERRPMSISGDGLTTAQSFKEDDIRKARFFLTTHNSAPETNPFNGPKISLWPVQRDVTLRTKFDLRMALAASLSGKEFFWQRERTWTDDANPGSSQSTSEDAGITRNLELIGYLQDLARLPMPGFGGSLEGKYGGGTGGVPLNSDQIITSMFDMLRWGVNIENADPNAGEEFKYLPPGRKSGGGENPAGEYSAVPMILGSADNTQVRGFGRFPTITEVALVFVATDAEKKDNAYVDEDGDLMADKTKTMQMFIILEPFCPVPGSPAATPAVRYRIKGLDKVKIEGRALFKDKFAGINRCVSMGAGDRRVIEGATGFNGIASQFLDDKGAPKKVGIDNEDSGFPFVSAEVKFDTAVNSKTGLIEFTAEPITLEILSAFGKTGDDDAIQTLRIPLPSRCKIPVPRLSVSNKEAADERIQNRFVLVTEKNEVRQRLIQNGDVVRSIEADPSLPWRGDLRVLAALGTRSNPPVTYRADPDTQGDQSRCVFPSPEELAARFATTEESKRALHSLRSGAYIENQFGRADIDDQKQKTADTGEKLIPGFNYPASFIPAVLSMPRESNLTFPGAINADGRFGDWNNGPGLIEDGPYIAKPDYGNNLNESNAGPGQMASGYFQRGGDFHPDPKGVNTAPYRQISSAIAFGSLPTGVYPRGTGEAPRPWQTLLFCPNPPSRQTEAGTALDAKDHFGFLSPPDHTWLEFFWMPVMDPYPLSPGCSTIGKVNMNYQIMPYAYIQRATAMHAALRGVRITAIPSSAASAGAGDDFYKNPTRITDKEFRYPVNATATLKGFDEERFKKGDVFRTASEICEMFLVPKRFGESETGGTGSTSDHDYGKAKPTIGLAYNKMVDWWSGQPGNAADAFEATGDNTRESPYAQLYPRLCTRSNVFQVHYRVQLIRKSRSTAVDTVDLTKDQFAAEYRGSTTVERYLDPNDKEVPDFASTGNTTQALDDFYRYRIISRQPFTP